MSTLSTVSRKNAPDAIALIVAFIVIAIWAETLVSSKILLEEGLQPADILFYRFILAYAAIWIISPKRIWAYNIKDELKMLFLGLSGGSMYFLAENTALEFSTASNVAILVSCTPLITACLSVFIFKDEKMNRQQVYGSITAFAGIILIILNGQLLMHFNPKGDILALTASLLWAFYTLVIKGMSDRYDAVFMTRKVFFYGILTIIPYFFIARPLTTEMAVLSKPAVWGNLVYLGLIAAMGCFMAWNWCISRLGTIRTTNIMYSQPFFAMVIAHFVLGDNISVMAIAGTIILISGMFMMNYKKKGKKHKSINPVMADEKD